MFELLDIIPDDYLIFSWKDEIIVDYFKDSAFRFIVLNDKHAYIRSFHHFWIEDVEESYQQEIQS